MHISAVNQLKYVIQLITLALWLIIINHYAYICKPEI